MIREYKPTDYETIKGWCKARNINAPEESALPKTGFIDDELAVGFLYSTDSSVCMIDGYVSNPNSGKEDRSLALDKITDFLICSARSLGFKFVKADTKNKSISARCLKHGFIDSGNYSSFMKEL